MEGRYLEPFYPNSNHYCQPIVSSINKIVVSFVDVTTQIFHCLGICLLWIIKNPETANEHISGFFIVGMNNICNYRSLSDACDGNSCYRTTPTVNSRIEIANTENSPVKANTLVSWNANIMTSTTRSGYIRS